MILIDAGPLVALVDRSDPWHERCLAFVTTIREPILTVWPAVTEAVFLVRSSSAAQSQVLSIVQMGDV